MIDPASLTPYDTADPVGAQRPFERFACHAGCYAVSGSHIGALWSHRGHSRLTVTRLSTVW